MARQFEIRSAKTGIARGSFATSRPRKTRWAIWVAWLQDDARVIAPTQDLVEPRDQKARVDLLLRGDLVGVQQAAEIGGVVLP
jgi:hypothetical protein